MIVWRLYFASLVMSGDLRAAGFCGEERREREEEEGEEMSIRKKICLTAPAKKKKLRMGRIAERQSGIQVVIVGGF